MSRLTAPVYMLAIDHRWQWEHWCDQRGVDRARIADVKALATDAFLLARRRSGAVADSGALLVDQVYGRDQIDRAREAGATVGVPAERAGVSPLEWQRDPSEESLPGAFVKVLVRHRPDEPDEVRSGQVERLLELQAWCRARHRPLVVEVLVPRAGEPEEAFEETGRPAALAAYIARAYDAGLLPDFWKIEGVPTPAAIRPIDFAIRQREGARQLILGKGAGLDAVARWFTAAVAAPTAGGFAIGRTVYWDAATGWLTGQIDRDAAVARTAETYLRVIDLWRRAHES